MKKNTAHSLDDLSHIKQLDKANVRGSVEALPDQCWHAWEEASKIKIPNHYLEVKNLVMTGMGGSGLGARLVESIYQYKLRVPLVRVNHYALPGFVDDKSLVICSSYSGSTEETIENFRQALGKNAKIMVLATGGKLLEMAKAHKVPFYKIDPVFNPSNQPRMAIGYSVVGQLVLTAKSGLINLEKKEISEVVDVMKKVQKKLTPEVPTSKNTAKSLAQQMFSKIIVYMASGHLNGASHTIKNQLNENAKTFAVRFEIPELNHHLMEGLRFPKTNQENLFCFLTNSHLFHPRIQERIRLTKEVIEKNKIQVYLWQGKASSRLAQAFEFIQYGSYVNFYLSMLYNLDPAPIPWVDYFKKRLSK